LQNLDKEIPTWGLWCVVKAKPVQVPSSLLGIDYPQQGPILSPLD